MIPIERINFIIEKLEAESELCAKQYSDKWNMDRDYHGAFGDGIDRALTLLESVVNEYEPNHTYNPDGDGTNDERHDQPNPMGKGDA